MDEFQAGAQVTWKAGLGPGDQAQIERWTEVYGPRPYTVAGVEAHPEVDHLCLVTPSGHGPLLPVTYFESFVEPVEQAEEPAAETDAEEASATDDGTPSASEETSAETTGEEPLAADSETPAEETSAQTAEETAEETAAADEEQAPKETADDAAPPSTQPRP